MQTTPARQEATDPASWVWPSFFLRPVAEWADDERAEAQGLLTPEEFSRTEQMGQYLGHRVGIDDDGHWMYFVAGD